VVELLLATLQPRRLHVDLHQALEKVEWNSVRFFIGLFMMIGALEHHEVFTQLGLQMIEWTGGDFVRTSRQLVDLLRQVATLTADPAARGAARQAVEAVQRGVVEPGVRSLASAAGPTGAARSGQRPTRGSWAAMPNSPRSSARTSVLANRAG
jgi:hypothetical protein